MCAISLLGRKWYGITEDSGETVFAAHICIYFSTQNLKVKMFFTDGSKAVLLL